MKDDDNVHKKHRHLFSPCFGLRPYRGEFILDSENVEYAFKP